MIYKINYKYPIKIFKFNKKKLRKTKIYLNNLKIKLLKFILYIIAIKRNIKNRK